MRNACSLGNRLGLLGIQSRRGSVVQRGRATETRLPPCGEIIIKSAIGYRLWRPWLKWYQCATQKCTVLTIKTVD